MKIILNILLLAIFGAVLGESERSQSESARVKRAPIDIFGMLQYKLNEARRFFSGLQGARYNNNPYNNYFGNYNNRYDQGNYGSSLPYNRRPVYGGGVSLQQRPGGGVSINQGGSGGGHYAMESPPRGGVSIQAQPGGGVSVTRGRCSLC